MTHCFRGARSSFGSSSFCIRDRTRCHYWRRATCRSFVFHELVRGRVCLFLTRMQDLYLLNDSGYVFHTVRICVIRVSGARQLKGFLRCLWLAKLIGARTGRLSRSSQLIQSLPSLLRLGLWCFDLDRGAVEMLLRSRNVRIVKWKIWEHLEILRGLIVLCRWRSNRTSRRDDMTINSVSL